jgi:hypothetical protein
MCPQVPRLSPEYSHKAGLQTVIIGRPLQIRPVTRSGHAGPVTVGRITSGSPCWTRPQYETTSSQVFVRRRVGRRVNLPVALSLLGQRGRRRHRAKGGIFAFAPTIFTTDWEAMERYWLLVMRHLRQSEGCPQNEKSWTNKGRIYLDVWPQMVVPSFSALLPHSCWQQLCYVRPLPRSKLFH